MDQKYNFESRNVRWSVAVLCVSFLLVYVVLFYTKGDLFRGLNDVSVSNNDDINSNDSLVLSEFNDSGSSIELSIEQSGSILDVSGSFQIEPDVIVQTGSDGNNLINIKELNIGGNVDTVNVNGQGMVVLPGTHTYYGDLDFVNLLGISYKYALVDEKGIYYLNIDGYTYDFSDIARKLGGNLYIMNTESEILANKMFGNKVTYINIPDYANKKVLMLIDVNNQSRLLAVDYSIYHQSKSYLQSLFIY